MIFFFFGFLAFCRLIQSIFLLPRYLQRNHEMIAKTLEKHSITEEELKAFEEEERLRTNEQSTETQPDTGEESKKIN